MTPDQPPLVLAATVLRVALPVDEQAGGGFFVRRPCTLCND